MSFASYPAPTPDPPKKKSNKTLMWVLIGAAALLVLLCAIGITLAVLLNADDDTKDPVVTRTPLAAPVTTGPSFTTDDAERECYAAFSSEFETRDAARDNQDFIATVTSIDVLDSRKVNESIVVNGTVHYSLVGAGVDTLNDTLELTCTASTLTTGQILTSVENRT